MAVVPSLDHAGSEERPRARRRWAERVLWAGWLVLFAGMLVQSEDVQQGRFLWRHLLFSPLVLLVVWIALKQCRAMATACVRRLPGPPLLKYLVIGLPLTTLLNTFAISFGFAGNDLHDNLWLNAVFWFGGFAGILLVFYGFRAIWTFGYRQVFLFTGLEGVLIEQDYLVAKTVMAGEVWAAILLAYYLIPIYGMIFGAPWIIMPPEQLPHGTRRPGIVAASLFIVTAALAFYSGAAAWFFLADLLLGTKFYGS